MKNFVVGLSAMTLVLTACESTTTPSYQTAPRNTIALMSVASSGERASVASVTANGSVNTAPVCRLMGSLDIGGGRSAEEAIRTALEAELLAGDVYSASGTPISVVLTEFAPDSLSGKWTIGGRVITPKMPGGYEVRAVQGFKTSFTAYSACNNTALAFNNAAAEFIHEIVTHPSFRSAI